DNQFSYSIVLWIADTLRLTMAENFQSAPFLGTECALQPSVPMLRNATPSAGSVCNFSRVSTPAVSSTRLLPSDSSTCCQQLMDSANPYQPAGTIMLTALTDESQSSTSTLSYPGVVQWDLPRSTHRREAAFRDFTVTVIDQNTTTSSWSMTAQGNNMLDPNALVPSCPTLTARLVQATPPQVPNQVYSLAPSYQDSQVVYYDHKSLQPLMAGELGQCLQAYGSVSYPGISALQLEMVMVLKEIQLMNTPKPFSTSAIYCPTPTQAMPDTSLQVVEMETSLGLTPSGQTLCLLQSPGLCNAEGTHEAQMKTSPVDGDRSLTALIHSPSEFLALPPAPSLEQTEVNNVDEMTGEQSMPLNAYEGTKGNQSASLLPLAHPNMQQPLKYPDAGSLRQKPASHNAILGSNSLGLEEPGALQTSPTHSLDHWENPTAIQSKDSTGIRRDQAQECSSIIMALSEQGQDLVEEAEPGENIGASEGAINNMDNKHLQGKAQKSAPIRPRLARLQGQDKTKRTRENNFTKTQELRPSSHRVKTQEKPTIPKTKRKRNPPELSHDSFKKLRTHLSMHMLVSVQVFHPLGKKSEDKTGISSIRALQNISRNK
ncbi:hypothetical protein A6R68_01692, partial [Neotoma lepida]